MDRDNRASVARAGQLQDGRRKQEVIRIRPDGLPSVPDLGANQCSSRYCQAELEEANGAIPARHHVSAPLLQLRRDYFHMCNMGGSAISRYGFKGEGAKIFCVRSRGCTRYGGRLRSWRREFLFFPPRSNEKDRQTSVNGNGWP
jgi:hypothetical protein